MVAPWCRGMGQAPAFISGSFPAPSWPLPCCGISVWVAVPQVCKVSP